MPRVRGIQEGRCCAGHEDAYTGSQDYFFSDFKREVVGMAWLRGKGDVFHPRAQLLVIIPYESMTAPVCPDDYSKEISFSHMQRGERKVDN